MAQLVAGNVFPKRIVIMTMRYKLGLIFEGKAFAALYSDLGQPPDSQGRLTLEKGATPELRPEVKMILQRRTGEEQL